MCCRFVTLSLGRGGVLQIHNVTQADGGLYRCQALNIAKIRRSAEISLRVEPGKFGIQIRGSCLAQVTLASLINDAEGFYNLQRKL